MGGSEEAHRGSVEKRLKCPHGKQKSRCKECGGSGICAHGRIKGPRVARGGHLGPSRHMRSQWHTVVTRGTRPVSLAGSRVRAGQGC
jgi:hypothetical protein